MLAEARPRALIEIGTKHGGSALLLHDFTRMLGLDCAIVSIDITPPGLAADGIRFLAGDVRDLREVFAREALFDLPRPWLAIEDSAHDFAACAAALRFFAEHLRAGEWLAMEDGVLDDLGWADRYQGGPNRAIGEFIARCPGVFAIGARYRDMFGVNATYNPNGHLQRTAAEFPLPSGEEGSGEAAEG